jgi:hypothetical protein
MEEAVVGFEYYSYIVLASVQTAVLLAILSLFIVYFRQEQRRWDLNYGLSTLRSWSSIPMLDDAGNEIDTSHDDTGWQMDRVVSSSLDNVSRSEHEEVWNSR